MKEIKRENEKTACAEFEAQAEKRYPRPRWSWTVVGPIYDRAPKKTVKCDYPVERVSYDDGDHTLLIYRNGRNGSECNLLDDGYDQYPYRKTAEEAVKQAQKILGDNLEVEAMIYHGTKTTGGKEIDGTGKLLLTRLVNFHSEASGGRFGGGRD